MRYLVFAVLFSGCGADIENVYEVTPRYSFEEIEPEIQEHCAGCHNGTKHPLQFKDEETWKSSRAKARIEARTMPPNERLSDEDYKKFMRSF